MLDLLGRGNHDAVELVALLVLGEVLLRFFDQTLHRLTGLALGALAHELEHLLEARHLVLRYLEMFLEGLLQFRVAGRLCHFGQSFGQLLLRVVKIAELLGQDLFKLWHSPIPFAGQFGKPDRLRFI
jgi:hypothetical protein